MTSKVAQGRSMQATKTNFAVTFSPKIKTAGKSLDIFPGHLKKVIKRFFLSSLGQNPN